MCLNARKKQKIIIVTCKINLVRYCLSLFLCVLLALTNTVGRHID